MISTEKITTEILSVDFLSGNKARGLTMKFKHRFHVLLTINDCYLVRMIKSFLAISTHTPKLVYSGTSQRGPSEKGTLY